MPDYHIFGAILRSEVPFPELIPADSPTVPTWVLSRVARAHSLPDLESVGKEEVETGVNVCLAASGKSLRLAFDDTGIFDVSADGRRIDWTPAGEPNLDAVRKDVLGRVFAISLHQEGMLALHGSAVELDGTAIAFIAPKFHGKSTTAMALVESGGRLLADDLVAVSPGPEPSVLPSVPFVQLWRDSAERTAGSSGSLIGDPQARKVRFGWDASATNPTVSSPLAAVYVLAPYRPDGASGVKRERLPGVQAALALLGQAKVVGLLGGRHRVNLLQRMADLAERVPVYRLEIPRDFDRIPELTSSLWAWHSSKDENCSAEPAP